MKLLFFVAGALAFKWPWQDYSTSTLQPAIVTESGKDFAKAPQVTNTKSFEAYFGHGQAYAPKKTACPKIPIVREASNVSESEQQYVANRQAITNEKMVNFLENVANLTDLDAESFVANAERNISVALAFSGGGYRAMLSGAGQLLALDDRHADSVEYGLGGLLQASTYISGLSGGSWLLGTLVLNDWMSVAEIMDSHGDIWNLDDSIFNPNGLNLFKTLNYYNNLRQAVNAKEEAGYDYSITDVWGRALSYQFFNQEKVYRGGENITWSGITQLESFKKHKVPFPIILANGRTPGKLEVNLNSTVFEITPYELGSWDESLNSFADIRYLGTSIDNGAPNVTDCVTNFDNAGFFLGTSSSIFNQVLLRLDQGSKLVWPLRKLVGLIIGSVSEAEADIATYTPNPFYNIEYAGSDTIVQDPVLRLADGGEDQQNVPYYPFLQGSRDVDMILSYDNSGDTNQNWPNGTSLVHTYRRQFTMQGQGNPFPHVPPVQEILKKKLNQRPVFYGCNASKLSDLVDYHDNGMVETDIPLVVYVPNVQYSFESNVSTFKMSYSPRDSSAMIRNGFETATRGNFSDDISWNTCLGCAIIRREQERAGEEPSDECMQCFSDYCWEGDAEDSAQSVSAEPSSSTSKSKETGSLLGMILGRRDTMQEHLLEGVPCQSNGIFGSRNLLDDLEKRESNGASRGSYSRLFWALLMSTMISIL